MVTQCLSLKTNKSLQYLSSTVANFLNSLKKNHKVWSHCGDLNENDSHKKYIIQCLFPS